MTKPTLDSQKQELQQAEANERTRDSQVFTARADIYETENAIVVLADMPGASEDSIDITLEKNVLNIRAAVEFEVPNGHSLVYGEYAVGDYERSFVLPNEIDRSKIEASVKDGVLHLFLPKSPETQPRKIAVKAA
jgi:HSP20 family molecular chaperone IbpA